MKKSESKKKNVHSINFKLSLIPLLFSPNQSELKGQNDLEFGFEKKNFFLVLQGLKVLYGWLR